MEGRRAVRAKLQRREVALAHDSYQPSKAELEQKIRFAGTLEEFAKLVLQPVKIRRSNPK